MPSAPVRILIVAGLCVLGLIGLVVRESFARARGAEVLLAMETVDPRSLLQGHYVTIALRERLEKGAECPETSGRRGWIALRAHESHHRFSGFGASRTEALDQGEIAVRGAVECSAPIPADETFEGGPGVLALQLDVDRFHINQADAQQIERVLGDQLAGEQRAFAIVSIGEDGRARLVGLMIDGERLELGWL